MTRRTRMTNHHPFGHQDDAHDPHKSDPSQDSMHPGRRSQDVHKTQERARAAWEAARRWTPLPPLPEFGAPRTEQQPPLNLDPDSAYAVTAWEQREQETRTARITAKLWQERARARAEERRRAIWSAMDTGPLILTALWPHPTPEPMPAIGTPDAILLAHPTPPAPGEPPMRFKIGERVAYSYASTRRWGVVEGARRFSTGWKYVVRWLCMNQQTHRLSWTRDVREVWEGYLTSMETRLLPRRGGKTVKLAKHADMDALALSQPRILPPLDDTPLGEP